MLSTKNTVKLLIIMVSLTAVSLLSSCKKRPLIFETTGSKIEKINSDISVPLAHLHKIPKLQIQDEQNNVNYTLSIKKGIIYISSIHTFKSTTIKTTLDRPKSTNKNLIIIVLILLLLLCGWLLTLKYRR